MIAGDPLTSTQKGAVAEAAVTAAAVELGFVVLRPVTEGRRYDLVIDTGRTLVRVQCKWAPRKGDVVAISTRTCRYTPAGYVRTTYRSTEVDGIAAYCADLRQTFWLPVADVAGRTFVHLRLAEARNGQRRRLRWAAQYPFGAIAQLGERVTGSHEVAGSSPASSTP